MTRCAVITVIFSLSCCAPAAAQLEAGAPEDDFELSEWVQGVAEVTDLAFMSDGRAVITRKTGEIAVARADGTLQTASAARVEVDSGSEKGLLGVVRDDRDRLYFYASTGDDTADKHKVYRGTLDADGKVALDLTQSIIGHGLEGPANHDGGGMIIYKGQLYVGVGDTGHNASPPVNRYGTCLNKANGKILRVNLDGSIPADNPLAGMDQVTGCSSQTSDFAMVPPDKRIYAWGLRNPWRFWIDPQTDLLWIGDVGEVTQEEITVGGKGVHHGWPFAEGTLVHGELGGLGDCMDVVPAKPCTAPAHGYPRADGVSVTGGLMPTAGCGWGAFEQRYFFADYGSGRVWTLDVKADHSGAVPSSRKPFANINGVVSFRMGPDGGMYVVSYGTGVIQRIVPKSVPTSCGSAAAQGVLGDSGTKAETKPSAESGGGSGGCGCTLASRHGSGLASVAALGVAALRIRGRRRASRVHLR